MPATSTELDVEQLAAPLLTASSPHSRASSLLLAPTAAPTAAAVPVALSSHTSDASSMTSSTMDLLWAGLQFTAVLLKPLAVMSIGIGFSVAALYVAVRDILSGQE